MPGMPIFQDSPSQLKGQVYVYNSSTQAVVPLQVDNSGSLLVNGTVDLEAGAQVTLAPNTEVGLAAGTVVGLAPNTEVGLAPNTVVGLAPGTDIDTVSTLDTITNDVKVVNGTTDFNVVLSAGTNLIGKVEIQPVFTSDDSFGAATPLTSKTIEIGATVESEAQDISKETSYNWFIKNTGAADITLNVQLSPDLTNWIDDTGDEIPVPADTSRIITVTHFLQYARFVITGGAAETTVISCFQAQH
jgi:hypothetical protein